MAVRDLLVLVKLRIVLLSAMLSAVGWLLAGREDALAGLLLSTLGTALVVASASLFNMALERDTDGRMPRTRNRPLPAGRVTPSAVYGLAILAGVLGLALLLFLDAAAFCVAASALVVYAFVYTPLKRRTAWAFLAGIGPGAAPPLIGWAAATGGLEGAGMLLFLWLLAWQIPHIMAIYSDLGDDYGSAGIPVLTGQWGDRMALAFTFPFTLATVALALLFGREAALGGGLQAMFLVLGVGFLAGHAKVLLGTERVRSALFLKRLTIWYASAVTCTLLIRAGFILL